MSNKEDKARVLDITEISTEKELFSLICRLEEIHGTELCMGSRNKEEDKAWEKIAKSINSLSKNIQSYRELVEKSSIE